MAGGGPVRYRASGRSHRQRCHARGGGQHDRRHDHDCPRRLHLRDRGVRASAGSADRRGHRQPLCHAVRILGQGIESPDEFVRRPVAARAIGRTGARRDLGRCRGARLPDSQRPDQQRGDDAVGAGDFHAQPADRRSAGRARREARPALVGTSTIGERWRRRRRGRGTGLRHDRHVARSRGRGERQRRGIAVAIWAAISGPAQGAKRVGRHSPGHPERNRSDPVQPRRRSPRRLIATCFAARQSQPVHRRAGGQQSRTRGPSGTAATGGRCESDLRDLSQSLARDERPARAPARRHPGGLARHGARRASLSRPAAGCDAGGPWGCDLWNLCDRHGGVSAERHPHPHRCRAAVTLALRGRDPDSQIDLAGRQDRSGPARLHRRTPPLGLRRILPLAADVHAAGRTLQGNVADDGDRLRSAAGGQVDDGGLPRAGLRPGRRARRSSSTAICGGEAPANCSATARRTACTNTSPTHRSIS